MKRFHLIESAVAIAILSSAAPVFASGFGIFTQGASALGQADAVVAHTDGPSAIFFNPALINSLPGTQIEAGTTAIFPSRKFTSAQDGRITRTEDDVFLPSTFYITHAVNDRVSAGIGVFNPFGLGTSWPDDWEGRYLATESEMTTFNINPVVSVRVNQHVTLAAGVDLILLDAVFKNRADLSPLGQSGDATQTFKGDGAGVGYNLGMLVTVTDDLSFGASYRSPVHVDVDGTLTTDLPASVAPGDQAALSALLPRANARARLRLPQQAFAGLYYKGFQPLEFEAGVRWEGWSSYDQLRLDLDRPVGGVTSSTRRKDWKDTFAYSVGATYRINDTVKLLGGYLYGDDPVPEHTFEPAIPDSPSHLFCLGTDLTLNRISLAIGYGLQVQERRHKSANEAGGTANGIYDSVLHLAAVSVVYRF